MVLALWLVTPPSPAQAGPVDWVELPPSKDGRQWWDRGSLRPTRDGHLSVLSRFSPAAGDSETPERGSLYVMEVDCDQALYRDVSVNGLPRWRASWQLVTGDPLLEHLLDAVCAADRDPAAAA
ncbi:hypothetical protein EVJ50_04650 [Synechococcus sp. RSCCF101]|nr:hypothetical protein EVJ50_04650 [Synechococcus sp. RSCCF101]